MPWDLFSHDRRIESAAVSTPRYVLRDVIADSETRETDAEHFRECRDCGTKVEGQNVCPNCGSTEIDEYDLGSST